MKEKATMIGSRIKSLRNNKNISQEELGKAIGLSQNTISKIENGDISLTLENLLKISSFFNVSTDYICTGVNQENILVLLEKYSKMEYRNRDCEQGQYEYPVLNISRLYFEYLIRIARARSDKYMPDDIRKLWIEKEMQNFNNNMTECDYNDYVAIIPIPDSFIYNDDEKIGLNHTNLIKEMDKFISDNLPTDKSIDLKG